MKTQLKGGFTSFVRSERGSIAPIFALSLLPMMGMVGVGIDYGRAQMVGSKMQNAVDQALLASAKLTGTARDTRISSLVSAAMAGTGLTVTVSPVTTVTASGSTTVTASISAPVSAMILSAVAGNLTVKRTATVVVPSGSTTPTTVGGSGTSGCFHIRGEGNYKHAFAVYDNSSGGSGSDVSDDSDDGDGGGDDSEASGGAGSRNIAADTVCDVHVTSTGSGSMNPHESGTDTNTVYGGTGYTKSFARVCTSGFSNSNKLSDEQHDSCNEETDPFDDVAHQIATPTVGGCDFSNTKTGTDYETRTNPAAGTYCGNFKFKGTVADKVFIVKKTAAGGESKILFGEDFKGTDVHIHCADEKSSLDFHKNVKLNAKTSGTYKDVLISTPRVLGSSSSNRKMVTIGKLDGANLKGLIYTPKWEVKVKSWKNPIKHESSWVANTMVLNNVKGLSAKPGNLTIKRYVNGETKRSDEPAPTTATSIAGTLYISK